MKTGTWLCAATIVAVVGSSAFASEPINALSEQEKKDCWERLFHSA